MNRSERGEEIVEESPDGTSEQKSQEGRKCVLPVAHKTTCKRQTDRQGKTDIKQKAHNPKVERLLKEPPDGEGNLHMEACVKRVQIQIEHLRMSLLGPSEEIVRAPFGGDKQKCRYDGENRCATVGAS